MKKLTLFISLLLLFLSSTPALAVYNPTSKTNNIFGIHILFPSELDRASQLVNSSGGDWGYVTIPIQYGDRDLAKWEDFMVNARKDHLIPIIRIATAPYYKNTSVWRTPDAYDLVDFANFLNSLDWPTKNRYVLMFNEVNRFDEWGGDAPAPDVYADFLSDAVDIFKARNPDFFVIAGGLDNASPNDGIHYDDNFAFLREMGTHNPDVFKKIDGFASHSYPNPDFAEPPTKNRPEGTSTYKYEQDIVSQFAGVQKPIFITETGWNADKLPQSVIAAYYKIAMNEIWGQDSNIVAVTPFVLDAGGGGPFDKFSFYKGDNLTEYGKEYKDLQKKRGNPIINPIHIVTVKPPTINQKNKFSIENLPQITFNSVLLKSYIKAALGIHK